MAPLYASDVEAGGLPVAAEDYVEQNLNLHDYAVRHKATTFFVRAHGYSISMQLTMIVLPLSMYFIRRSNT